MAEESEPTELKLAEAGETTGAEAEESVPPPPAKKSKLEELLSRLDEEMEKAGDDIVAPVSAKDDTSSAEGLSNDLSSLLKRDTESEEPKAAEKSAAEPESPQGKKNLADLLKNLDEAAEDTEPELIGETEKSENFDNQLSLKSEESPNDLVSKVFSSQAESPENLRKKIRRPKPVELTRSS